MSFDVTTLALAKSYTDQHGGDGGGGASTADKVSYINAALPNISTVRGALDELVPKSHTHANKDTLDKLSDSNGKLQYNGSDVGLKGDKGDKGAPGAKGADGKSAYQYAVEGGYTGTETEFAEKLAQEQLTGTTGTLTPSQVYNAVSAGIPVKVQYTDSTYGLLSFIAFNIAESLNVIVSQTIAYNGGVYILAELVGYKSGNRWATMFTTLAQKTDIPSSLKNPNALTIKIGSTTVTYDGSTAETVEIADGTEVSY